MSPTPPASSSSTPVRLIATRSPKRLAHRIIRNGWLIILALALGDIILNHFGVLRSPINRSFNIAREDAIGTWFSILQLVGASIVSWLLYRWCKSADAPTATRRSWGYLAVLFMYMSIDDAAKIHERLGTLFSDGVAFFPSYAWQAVYAPVFGTATLVLLYVAWRLLEDNSARMWTVLGVGLLVGAVGLDFLEGIDPADSPDDSSSASVAAPAQAVADVLGADGHDIEHFQRVLEESMEMAAITLFLGAFVLQLGSHTELVSVSFNKSDDDDSAEAA